MALVESEAPRDPLTLFRRWYRDAQDAGAPQPDAMTLATCGEEGPSARMVLLKGIEDGAFLFYTNYGSRKGRDLAADKSAALVFYWSVTHHQVRVSVVKSRDVLERAALELAKKYPAEAPLPPDWGGYAVRPRWIEFWESREDRLHDRLRYVRKAGGRWAIERLAP
ncbi:MAG: pyridoxamine 5'-phosphate oxidase [Chloroflexi bacterium]|nr:MAG: pyridoxamine 5'-phosphate oxidase [Chloroflexota bacterium]